MCCRWSRTWSTWCKRWLPVDFEIIIIQLNLSSLTSYVDLLRRLHFTIVFWMIGGEGNACKFFLFGVSECLIEWAFLYKSMKIVRLSVMVSRKKVPSGRFECLKIWPKIYVCRLGTIFFFLYMAYWILVFLFFHSTKYQVWMRSNHPQNLWFDLKLKKKAIKNIESSNNNLVVHSKSNLWMRGILSVVFSID